MMSLAYIQHINALHSTDTDGRADLWDPIELAADGTTIEREDPEYDEDPGRDYWTFNDPARGSFDIDGPAGHNSFTLYYHERPDQYIDGCFDDIFGHVEEIAHRILDCEDGPANIRDPLFDDIFGGPAEEEYSPPATSGPDLAEDGHERPAGPLYFVTYRVGNPKGIPMIPNVKEIWIQVDPARLDLAGYDSEDGPAG